LFISRWVWAKTVQANKYLVGNAAESGDDLNAEEIAEIESLLGE
jgi:hypothetical protein